MAERVRVAVIGCGFIGRYHARAVKACADAELVAAADVNAHALAAFGEELGVGRRTTAPESLADDPDIDAVAIGVPNAFHLPLARRFLEAGKHVLLEKPMAMNTAEALQIQDAADKHDRRLLIGHMWRFDPEARFLRRAVKDGLLGRIVKTKGYGIHTLWGPSGWFAQKELAGGGALADMGVHAIDTVRYLLGDPQPTSVYARIGTHYGSYDVDDTGVIVITWDTGTSSIIESGWWQPHMDGPEGATQLFGTRGYGRIFPTELRLELAGLPGRFQPKVPEREDHCAQFVYDGQMAHFVQCVRLGRTPVPGGAEGLVIMKIVDAAYRSAETGEAVAIH